MSEIVKSEAKNIVALRNNADSALMIPKPFEQEIFLFETYIAGTSFIEDIEEISKKLDKNERLDFYREPNNKHDNNAIVIKNSKGLKLGYVPRVDNIVFSRLMDAGKLLFGKIESIEIKGDWVEITIRIFLKE